MQGGHQEVARAADTVSRKHASRTVRPVCGRRESHQQQSRVVERVTIMDLRESMCRWPMGDPTKPEFRFCGARSVTVEPGTGRHYSEYLDVASFIHHGASGFCRDGACAMAAAVAACFQPGATALMKPWCSCVGTPKPSSSSPARASAV